MSGSVVGLHRANSGASGGNTATTLDPEYQNPGSVHQSISPMNTPGPELRKVTDAAADDDNRKNEAYQVWAPTYLFV
jgi:hypothetical protein